MATVIAPRDFSPVEDAENIKKACQGWGTDEEAIISILGHRNLFQRRLIRSAYQEIYNEDLIVQLKSELSAHFQRAVCQWVLDPADRDAVYINAELKKTLPDHRVIIEIASLRSPEDLLAARRAYRFRFKRSLEEDVASHTKGFTRKILVALTSAYRYDGEEIDWKMAEAEARVVHEEIHGGETGNNKEEVVRILSTRSKPQLNATFNQYKNIYATSITKSLSIGDSANEYGSSLLRTAIRCIKNPQRYLAKVLRNAIRGKGSNNEEALSRVIITRAEKDLKEIKEVFFKRTSATLENEVSREISGDLNNFLLTLLGKEY